MSPTYRSLLDELAEGKGMPGVDNASTAAAFPSAAWTADNAGIARVIETYLLKLLKGEEDGNSARIQAAKLLLDRLGPAYEDHEAQRHEAEERAAAIAEAQAILAEFAVAKLAGVSVSPALAADGPPGTADAVRAAT